MGIISFFQKIKSRRLLRGAYRSHRSPEELLEDARRVLSVDPSFAKAWNLRGLLQIRMHGNNLDVTDEYDREILHDLKKACDLAPKNRFYASCYVDYLGYAGRTEEASAFIQGIANMPPGAIRALKEQAMHYAVFGTTRSLKNG